MSSLIDAKSFPIQVKEQKDVHEVIELISFNRSMPSYKVLDELGSMGLRAAPIEGLLAFGGKYQEVKRDTLIIACGSSCSLWDDVEDIEYRYHPCLLVERGKRYLKLAECGTSWIKSVQFEPSTPEFHDGEWTHIV